MSTKSIRTEVTHSTCDVCGRTLLRGERAEVYLSGGTRRSVCELCTSRAVHGGWVREGTTPAYGEAGARTPRRRSFLSRLFGSRDDELPSAGDGLADGYYDEDDQSAGSASTDGRGRRSPAPALDLDDGYEPLGPYDELEPVDELPPEPEPRSRSGRRGRSRSDGSGRNSQPSRGDSGRSQGGRRQQGSWPGSSGREPRHVRAVPTSIEHRISSAVSMFNSSEHPRTVAGIARSLGLPQASVHPADEAASLVNVVVAWELCWYRYEVDLSEDAAHVRVAGQGYELSELRPIDLEINAVVDERGRIDL